MTKDAPPQRRPSAAYRFRGFVSWLATLTFLLMLGSGIAMYFTPRGMIAHWTEWTLLGLTKDQWSAVHMAASLVFFVAAVLHIYLNWRPLWCYLRGRAGRMASLWIEAAVALLLTVLVAIAAYFHLPPVSYLVDANEAVKQYWTAQSSRPPVPHAERMSLSKLSQYVGVPAEQMVDALRAEGYDVPDTSAKISELARQKGVSAATVFEDLAKHHPEITAKKGGGRGMRRGEGKGRGRGTGQ